MPLPDTVQAVIAARLDALPASHKAVLCDAAVLGETFWDGGVMALSDRDRDEVDDVLAALIERQLVRPVRSSSLKDENEYLFWHALARDVAYEQLPRRARLRKHQDAGEWIERKAGERIDDVAEILAHHFDTAHGLAQAARGGPAPLSRREPATTCGGRQRGTAR